MCAHSDHFAIHTMPTNRSSSSPRSTAPAGLNRRRWLQGALGLTAGSGLLALGGCGSSSEEDTVGYVRVVNATEDFSTATVLVDGDTVVSSLAYGGAVSDYVSVSSGSHTVTVKSTSGTTGPSSAYSFNEDTSNTLVAYGSLASGMSFVKLEESTSTPGSSSFKVRVLHANWQLDGLDVYLSNESSLSDLSPDLSVDASGDLSSFVTLDKGSYRLRITVKDDHSTVLFDSGSDSAGSITFSGDQAVTLAVVPRSSGSLPDVTALPEGNSAVVIDNSLV
ncbi:MAG: hypothetical protein RLZZ494_1260 [Pseudomonadota bacterium]|jgi:Domain of unknown function (DUF4397)